VAGNARLSSLVVNIDLQANTEIGTVSRSLLTESLGDPEAVHRVYPVKLLGNGPGLVGLQVADKVPAKVVAVDGIDLLDAFLDEVFAKIALPGLGCCQDARNGLLFAHCQQSDGAGIATCIAGCLRQQISDYA
jgi:hypothetical protein